MKKIFSLLFLFLNVYFVSSQNIDGNWIGVLTQHSGGVASNYMFTANFNQRNSTIKGFSTIRLYDNQNIYGKIKLSGTFENNILDFQEKEVLSEAKDGRNFEWCIKTGKLYYSVEGDTAILEGKWTSIRPTTCAPGTIRLTKYMPNQSIDNQQNNNSNDANNNNNAQVNNDIDNNRAVKQGITIDVPSEDLTIIVSESAKEDNDTLSIIFNDVPVLVKHRLTKHPYQISVKCTLKNKNKLVLYAHNVGYVPPNTAKIEIISDNFKKTVILQSNMDESDVIYINVK